jgi:hypothetical protein
LAKKVLIERRKNIGSKIPTPKKKDTTDHDDDENDETSVSSL